MIPTGFAILATVGTFLMGYAIGGIIEHHKSQNEIDILTRIIEGRSEEDYADGS